MLNVNIFIKCKMFTLIVIINPSAEILLKIKNKNKNNCNDCCFKKGRIYMAAIYDIKVLFIYLFIYFDLFTYQLFFLKSKINSALSKGSYMVVNKYNIPIFVTSMNLMDQNG